MFPDSIPLGSPVWHYEHVMRVSVILSTYNAPDWLEKVIWGYSAQTHRDFELLIADDGSGQETRTRIERLREQTDLSIRHLWQPDEGFKKTGILNKAILQAQADYLLFSDGDCIPRRDFIEAHVSHAAPGRFLSAGTFWLPLATSKKITKEDVVVGRAFELGWLRRHELGPVLKWLKLTASGRGADLLNAITPTRATWNGHNSSAWKSDVLAVNGFDERMLYGGEDREFGERLRHHGVRPKQIRFSAVCLHLDHTRGYVTDESWSRNRAIRTQTRCSRTSWTEFGIERTGQRVEPPVGGSPASGSLDEIPRPAASRIR
jgi:glycosyltransferase involved in cell wall biosynthesis